MTHTRYLVQQHQLCDVDRSCRARTTHCKIMNYLSLKNDQWGRPRMVRPHCYPDRENQVHMLRSASPEKSGFRSGILSCRLIVQ